MSNRGGHERITVDSAIGASGKPTRMYGAQIVSGSIAGVVNFRNGTGTGDTAILATVSGAANQGFSIKDIPAEGIYFPAGLFVDVDANTTAVDVWYEVVTIA